MQDSYDKYRMSAQELMKYILLWLLQCGVLTFMFYRSLIAFVLLSLAAPIYIKRMCLTLNLKRKNRLLIEFKDCLHAVQAAIQAGYSTENAFRQTYGEMEMLYGSESDMVRELYRIQAGLNNNLVLEHLLDEFASRCGIEEINDFAEVFRISKRTGGDLDDIIKTTADTIDGKAEVQREVETLVTSQNFELKIMCLVPLLILLYVGSTTPGFFDCLYHNLTGIALMSGCMAVYVAAILIGGKLMNIKFR